MKKKLAYFMAQWTPRVTVAAVIEDSGKYLLVKELSAGKTVYNQPAGHLENNESLIDAVKREVFEETGLAFKPTALLDIRRWQQHSKQRTYLRFAFTGTVEQKVTQPRDSDILEALWLSLDEIRALTSQHRSPQVMAGINAYTNGTRYNLDLLNDVI